MRGFVGWSSMPTTACVIHHSMVILGQALAHNQSYLLQLCHMAGAPTVSGQALRIPRVAFTVITMPTHMLRIRHAAGGWQQGECIRAQSSGRGGLSAAYLRMLAGGAHRQGRSVPYEEPAVHAGRGAEWQHVRHAGCLHRVCMPCTSKHILGRRSCSLAYSRSDAKSHC